MKNAHATLFLALAVSLTGCGSDDPAALVASAKAYIAKRDYTAAIIQAKNALQKDPDNREARYVLGLASLETGDLVAAELNFKKAVELGYSVDEGQVALARAMLARGETGALVTEFGETKLSAPKAQAELLAIIGAAELQRGRGAAAQAAFMRALGLDGTNTSAHLGLARLAAAARDWKGSSEAVEAALAASPLSVEGLVLKAELLSAQGENEAATKAYRAAVEASPGAIAARVSLIAHLMRQRQLEPAAAEVAALEKVAPKHPSTSYMKAALLIERRKWKEAREALQHVLKVSPEHVPTLIMAGMTAHRIGAYAEAESHLRRALYKAPQSFAAKHLLAATHLRMGQNELAMTEIRELLEKAPDDPKLLALAGEAELRNGDAAAAARYYERAQTLVPESARLQTRVAQLHIAGGEADKGVAELEAAAASSNEEYQADLALIAIHLRQRQADKALEAVQALEKKQPDNPLTHNLRGTALLLKKDYAKARASFERAVQLKPNYLPAVSNLARLDLRDKKPQLAKQRYEAVLKQEPNNEQALHDLAVLMRLSGASNAEIEIVLKRSIAANPASSNARTTLVNHYLRVPDVKAALGAAQEASVALPNNPGIVRMLATIQLAAGENHQAIGTIRRFVEMQPKSTQPLLMLAQAQLRVGQPDEAIKALRAALALQPDLASAHRDITAIHLKTGRAEQAIKEARDLQTANPTQPIGYILEAEVYVAQKKWDAAERVYRAASKKFDHPALAMRTHAVLHTAGKTKEASAFADQWIVGHPKDAFMLNYLGEQDIAAKRYESAVKRYESARERAPDNPAILNNLALVKHQLKQPAAREIAEDALRLAPENAAIMETLGVILVDTGEQDRGLELLGSAAERAPQAHNIRLNFAKALVKANRKDAARKELEALTKLDSRNPIQQQAVKLLARL